MKSVKHFAVAGMLATALAQSAHAAVTHVYVTGSTAYRTQAIASISTALGLAGATGDDTAATTGPKNTSFIWEGGHVTLNGVSTAVTVVATFTGSAAGVITTTDPGTGNAGNPVTIPFLPDGSAGHAIHAAYDDSVASIPHSGYPLVQPQFTFTDAYQVSTPANPNNVNSNGDNYIDTTSDGHDFVVGILTFKWCASANFPLNGGTAPVSKWSVDPNFIAACFGAGKAPLSQITGNSADRHKVVFATGRNPDSGTRICALADSLYSMVGTSFDSSKEVIQYQAVPEITTTGVAVTQHQRYPIETINGISTNDAGNSGQASGGTLRNYMTATLATSGMADEAAGTTAAYYITCLGISDFAAVSSAGAVELAWKGINYSNAAVLDGSYTNWSYEHIMDRGDLGPATGASQTAAATLEAAIVTSIKAAGTDVSGVGFHDDATFAVKRFGDGLPVIPKFVF